MSALEKYNSDLSPGTLAMLQASDVTGDVALDPIQSSGKQSQLMLLAALYPMLAQASNLTNSNTALPSTTNPASIQNFNQLLQSYQTLIDEANETFEEINNQNEDLQAFLTQIFQTLPKDGEDLGAVLKQGAKQFIDAMQNAFPKEGAYIQALSQSFDDEIDAITNEQAASKAAAPQDTQPSTPQINYMQAVLQMVSSLMMLSVQVAQTEAVNSENQTDFMDHMQDSMSIVMTNQANNIHDMLQKQHKLKRRMFFVHLVTPTGMCEGIGRLIGGDKGAKIGSYIGEQFFSMNPLKSNITPALLAITLKGLEERYDIKTPKDHVQQLAQMIGGNVGSMLATAQFQYTFGSKGALINEGGTKMCEAVDNEQFTEDMKKIEQTKGAYAIDLAFQQLFQAIAKDPDADWVNSAARWSTVGLIAAVMIAIMIISVVLAPEALPEEATVAGEMAAESGVVVGEAVAEGAIEAAEQEAASMLEQISTRLESMAKELGDRLVKTASNPTRMLAIVQSLMGVYKMGFDTANSVTYSKLAKLQEKQGELNANLQAMKNLIDLNQQTMQSAFKSAQNQVASLTASQNVYAVTSEAKFAANALA